MADKFFDFLKFLEELEENKIKLWVDNAGKLRYRAPEDKLDTETKNFIIQYKEEIINILSQKFPLIRIHGSNLMPLSFSQKRLWFLQQLDMNNIFYNIPMAALLKGNLKINYLEQALNEIIKRHDILRTAFIAVKGQPWQKIEKQITLKIENISLLNLEENRRESYGLELLKQAARQPFHLTEAPLIKATLIQIAEDKFLLLLNLHHLVADGYALNLFGKELSIFYDSFVNNQEPPFTPLKIQYTDFAYWQRNWVRSADLQNQLCYWKNKLANLTSFTFPTDHPRPAKQSFQGDMESFIFPKELANSLDSFSRKMGVTTFITILTTLNILLARYSGQTDIILATPVSTRTHADLENLIGTFMNTLIIRTNMLGNPTINELLQQVKNTVLEAFDHQDLPFDLLVDELKPERSLSHAPLFQILFLFEKINSSIFKFDKIETSPLNIPLGTSRFDIVLFLYSTERGLEGALEYATDLFKKSTIIRLIEHLRILLETVIKAGNQPIAFIPFLTTDEKNILDHNNETTQPCNLNNTFTSLFNQIVEKYPQKIALVYRNEQLTYTDLNKKASALAFYLQNYGVKPGKFVGVFLPASCEAIIAIIATIKAGGAYIPIDPSYPEERITFIIQNSTPNLLITRRNLIEKIATNEVNVLFIDNDIDDNNIDFSLTSHVNDAQDPIYLIYTSGSSGRPKGVCVKHRSVINLNFALEQKIYANYTHLNNITLNGSLSFDTSVKQLIQLLNGRTIHIIADEIRYDGPAFIRYLIEKDIDVLDCTPTQCRLLMRYGLFDLFKKNKMVVLIGGEDIDYKMWDMLKETPLIDFYNVYGPSECTVDAAVCFIDSSRVHPSIGFPLANIKIYILDQFLQPVPIGLPGEIYISGECVSLGYFCDTWQTAEKFVPDHLSANNGQRMYKSGDLGRYNEDGTITFLGRNDQQIKIRGFRVELNEIAMQLMKHSDIQNALVMQSNNDSDKDLIAYVIPSLERSPTIAGLTRYRQENDLAIVQLNKNETDFLYHDVFENNAYLRNGIVIEDGDIIFDVGANIGLFSLQAHLNAHDIKIFAFEPNPFVKKLLDLNLKLYQVNAQVYEYALSNQIGSAQFTFYPKMSFLSGLHADYHQEKSLIHSYIYSTHSDSIENNTDINEIIDNKLDSQTFWVKTDLISNFIQEHNIEVIHLLKINVEKSELSVLEGITKPDWGKIQQIVIEVHDIAQRLNTIRELLLENGFSLTEENDWSVEKNQNIYYLYGTKLNRKSKNPKNLLFPKIMEKEEVIRYLEKNVPYYMLASQVFFLEEFPMNENGKIDKKKLLKLSISENTESIFLPQSTIEKTVAEIFSQLLNRQEINVHDNFFDIGGHSLLLTQLYALIQEKYHSDLKLIDIFSYPTVRLLSERISSCFSDTLSIENKKINHHLNTREQQSNDIAVIAMTGRFPQSADINQFWQNLIDNKELISRFDEQSLYKNTDINKKNYIPVRSILNDIDLFDAHFFGFSPREAEILDPQQRIFLECAWEALEKAGYDTSENKYSVGLFAGQSISTYLFNNLYPSLDLSDPIESYQVLMANDKDHLTLRTAHKLNLNGPVVSVQTACSTSLVAIHMAVKSLLAKECDIALAGAVSIIVPENTGYTYRENGIFSPDGHCRAFDEKAQGTVGGNGVGVIVLKRLTEAIAEKDNILAVIKGSAINNDGSKKIGYTAPSVAGQSFVIQKALDSSGLKAEDISYIEAHGTGTALGDPIELTALNEVFNEAPKQYCALGSIKTNIGHLDVASGVIGLIKVILAFNNEMIPASINFNKGNPSHNWENSPFYIANKNIPWTITNKPRRAGVSSFGIGGTNAHIILEERPVVKKLNENDQNSKKQTAILINLSANSPLALKKIQDNLKEAIEKNPLLSLTDVAYTLHVGRKAFNYRWGGIFKDKKNLLATLMSDSGNDQSVHYFDSFEQPLVFSFLEEDFYSEFYSQIYQNEIGYRDIVDEYSQIIQAHTNLDVQKILMNNLALTDKKSNQLLAFLTQYFLAKFYIYLGLNPQAIISYGVGEFVAICLTEMIDFEEMLQLLNSHLDLLSQQNNEHNYLETNEYFNFKNLLSSINWKKNKIPLLSVSHNIWVTSEELNSLQYWIRSTNMDFESSLQMISDKITNIFILFVHSSKISSDWLHNLKDLNIDNSSNIFDRKNTEYSKWLKILNNLWLRGIRIDWHNFYIAKNCRRVELPTYPFQRQKYWIEDIRQLEAIEKNRLIKDSETYFKNLYQRSGNLSNYLAPVSEIENKLAEIFSKVLGIENISLTDDFFSLGGDSLSLIRLSQMIVEQFQVEFDLSELYSNPTIDNISKEIEIKLQLLIT